MSNLAKKVSSVALSVTTAVWLSGAAAVLPVAHAQSADLQAQIAALLAQIQTLQAQLASQGGAGAAASCNFTRDLTVGSSGEDVKCLQQYLNASGYKVADSGAGSPGSESTYFGSKSQAAVAKWQAAKGLSPAVGYFGPKSRAKYSESASATPAPQPGQPPVGGFGLSAASDNPAAASVPKGASGVTFLKFNVTGSGTLTSLTFKRSGLGATTDLGSVYLYEGSKRLTTGKSLNSTTHEVNFPNLNLAVSGSKALSLVADVSSSANSNTSHAFELVSAIGSPNPSGSLKGNAMTVANQAVGTITVDDAAAPSNPNVGQMGALLAEVKLTAGATEDLKVTRLALTEGGSIANSNLSNFVLKFADQTVATAASVGDRDLVSLQFSSPYLIEKGQEKTFRLYGDIGGSARSSETVVFYMDSASDVYAVGQTYGYAATPTITNFDTTSEADTLTLQGAQVTITFNGPVTGDLALRGQDVTLYDFTIAAQNNIEIRNLRMHATTTNLGSGEAFNDFKVWDASSNTVITSAVDISTSTDQTFTDVINVSAGQSKRYKVTADIDPDNDTDDTILVSLLAFQSNDVRNLDNNTFVSTSDMVPNSTVAGNTQTVKAPTLDVQLSALPTSQTQIRGAQGVALVGFSYRAIADDIKVSSVKVTATSASSTGTLTTGELQNLALYDGGTRVSDFKSLDSSLTATFSNLNVTVPKGSTKVLTVGANVAADATADDIYAVSIATVSSDVTAYDSTGNTASLSGTSAPNSGGTSASVKVTVKSTGDVSVVESPEDSDSEAGVVIAGQEQVLAKFRFTASNEAMTVNKMKLLVVGTESATATSAAAADEVPLVKLYDGATQIGASGGYVVQASGDNSGEAVIENLGWVIPKDSSKTLTVKGLLNSTAGGADTGASVYTSVMAANFEAQGSTALDTSITAATGNEKVVYKTKPTFGAVSAGSGTLVTGTIPTLKFKIKADGPEQIAWKQIQFKVSMTGATMSAVNANPGQSGNVSLKRVGAASNLNIASAFSSTATTTGEQAAITGGNTGYVSLLLNAEEVIPAGTEQEYELSLTYANLTSGTGNSSAVVNVHRSETVKVSATTVAAVRSSLGTATDAAPSFVWSDYSDVSHTESTTDWANGYLLKLMPSPSVTISN